MEQPPLYSAQDRTRRTLAWADGELPVGERTLVVGVLNVTPDSFYDGGWYNDPAAAAVRAHEMVEEGADIIDIGGQSSRPFSDPVTAEDELARVAPVIEKLDGEIEAPLSIDTYYSEVAEYAISRGVRVVNDITALTHDPKMLPLVARENVAVILMHMRGTPKTMQAETRYDDLLNDVKSYLAERARAALAAGVRAEGIVIDPGIGFGKSARGNLQLLGRLHELRELRYPILVGASRKSFIGSLLGRPEEERLEGSLGAAAVAVMNGADILRVHDVRETVRVVRIVDAIRREGNGSCHL